MIKQNSVFRSMLLAGIVALMAQFAAAQVERTPKDTTKIQFLNPQGLSKPMGYTQVVAARRLSLPQPTLSKIINGRVSDLSIEFLLRVAIRAGLPLTLQTGRNATEAGAH